MTRDDILTLARAGFTADQIAALASINAPAPQPAPAPAPAPAQQPAPAPAPQPDHVAEILTKLGVLTDAIQSNGILGSNQPPAQTPDDILATIIAPSKKEEK